ncbi:MAG: DUF4091 domain-containing protein [Armatimonadia bacterium]|nr:DUF4091 domain-containing protein [Armatimonadia bacterium]
MRTTTIVILALIGAVATCFAAEPIDTHLIDSFEAADAMGAWELRSTMSGEVVAEHATDGDHALRLDYPKWVEGAEQWPAAILDVSEGLFHADWSSWGALVFDVYCEAEAPTQLKIHIRDAAGENHQTARMLQPGERTSFAVDLKQLPGELDATNMTQMHLYMTRPSHASTLYVDNLRLEAYPVGAEGLIFAGDPLGWGHVQVTGNLIRPGDWTIGVIDAQERVVVTASGTGEEIDWQWDAMTDEGAPAEPGAYRVVARITDLDRPNAPPAVIPLGNTEIWPEDARREIKIWHEPTTKKVMLHSRPKPGPVIEMRLPEGPSVYMARNEVEGVQLVTLTHEQERLRFEMGELTHDSGAPFDGDVEIMQVGYAKTQHPGMYEVPFVGWWPDPLIPAEQIPRGEMIAEPYECMPIWINVRSTKETFSGTYRGELLVHRSGEDEPRRVPLIVVVHDVTIPDSTTITTAFALYEGMIKNTYGDAYDEDLLLKFRKCQADHRINPSDIYRRQLHDIEMLKYFDERDQLNAFCVRYIRRSEDGEGWQAEQLAELQAELDPFVAKLREEGLVDKGYFYGFDERGPEYYPEMARVGRFLKENYPDIPFVTTARDNTYGLESGLDGLVDAWVPLTSRYDPEAAEAARERGTSVWWYICIGPEHPYANWFVEYPAIESRLLWWMTYQQRSEGFLYYTMSRWPNAESPMTVDGRNKTDWDPQSYRTANGDGCLIVAGPEGPLSTVRLENIRDGIEDYELLTILAERRGDGGEFSRVLSDKLITTMTDYTRDADHFAEVHRRLLRECEVKREE